LATPEQI
jgi:hypothetical protein